MADQRVIELLEKQKFDYEICDFPRAFKSTEDASQLLGVAMSRMAKTLVYRSQFGAQAIILPGDRLIDSRRYLKKFGTKPYILEAEELEELTGCQPGAVTPIALKTKKVSVYMDITLKEHSGEFIYPSGGTNNSAIGIGVQDLYELSHSKAWVDITKTSGGQKR